MHLHLLCAGRGGPDPAKSLRTRQATERPTSYGYVVRQQSRAEAALEERTVSREIDSSFFLCSYGDRTGDLTYGAARLRAKTACSAANGEPNHRPLGVFNFELLYCARRQDTRQQ